MRRPLIRSGFTLVELMVAMLLASILVGVISFVFMQSSRIHSETLDDIDATVTVRSCLEMIADDLRGIQVPPAAGPYDHLQIDRSDTGGPMSDRPNDVLRYTTLNRWMGATSAAADFVTIEIDATTGFLTRNDGAGTLNLAASVEAFQVMYAWPAASGAMEWLRGDTGTGTVFTNNGTKFAWGGAGAVNAAGILTGPAYGDIPLDLARTAYITAPPQLSGGFPIVGTGTSTATIAGAPAIPGATFIVPLLPKKLKIMITHRTPAGHQRSLERVINVMR